MAQTPVNDIWICSEKRCAGQCDDPVDLCQYLIAGCDATGASTADLMYTNNSGTDWANSAAVPFGNDEDVISNVCFQLDQTTTRWLVVRGAEAAPANPIEVAYSDDGGATWTNVDVEAAGTRYAVDSGALWALDPKHIWLVTSGGYIFFTGDGGVTWTPQDEGLVTAGDYYAVMFANINDGFAVAASGVVVRTIDGGSNWDAVTAITGTPEVLSVVVFDRDNVMVGDDNGAIWRSWDGGTTWTQIYTGSTAINDMSFADRFVGFACDGALVVRTRNGGEDWESIPGLPSMTEFNAVVACSWNYAFAVGEDASNNGAVVKIGS